MPPQYPRYLGLFTPGHWDPSSGKWVDTNIAIKAPGSWPEMTTAHEIGHFLDYSGLQGGGYSTDAPGKLLRLLLQQIEKTSTYKALAKASGKRTLKYLMAPRELFARAYAQYVAWRSGDETMLGQIDRVLALQGSNKLRQWPYADFLPLIYRFDRLFEAQGWLTRTKL